MEAILDFLVNNYLWFLIISLILIFGLIGYIVDSHEKKAPKLHFQKSEDINMNVSEANETKSLKEMIEENEANSLNQDELTNGPAVVQNDLNIEELENKSELPNE